MRTKHKERSNAHTYIYTHSNRDLERKIVDSQYFEWNEENLKKNVHA